PNVTVLLDRPESRATTDVEGRFVFSRVPPGTRSLELRAVGFRPSRVGVNLRPTQRLERSITLDRNAAMLGTVTVRASKPATWDSLGFLERRRRGGGYFFTRETLKGITDISTALRMVPGVSGRSNEQSQRLVVGRGAGCFPAYVVNGVRFGSNSAIGPEAFMRAEDVRAIEVYNSRITTPPEYQRYSDCAVIVIWLRDRQGEIEARPRPPR
ncbi:MAG TPA: carboxypeptidase regulatory-like domain-containing protein, partial [Gemmatimonadaceae bacterium]|nr:carboxypeptidase regulatory-like domain-containing protein [Gemmatimonadaceae bacterium]